MGSFEKVVAASCRQRAFPFGLEATATKLTHYQGMRLGLGGLGEKVDSGAVELTRFSQPIAQWSLVRFVIPQIWIPSRLARAIRPGWK